MFNSILLLLNGAAVGASSVVLLNSLSAFPALHSIVILLNVLSATAIATALGQKDWRIL